MPQPVHKLDVALQGGGAHGAFTWGVLDFLLEQPDIDIGAVSGASAGALNAAVLASGLAQGGREMAGKKLWAFWKALNRSGREAGPLLPMAEAFPFAFEAMSEWWAAVFKDISLPTSPQMGRPAQDILRRLIEEFVDFEAIRSSDAPLIFVSATNARTGGAHIFRNDDLSVDALLASACLPLLFPPVSINGADYWDGGYSANPPIMPLVQDSPNDDLLLVTINPITRDVTPHTTTGIANRITELGFNQTLVKELRGLDLMQKAVLPLAPSGGLLGSLQRLRIHEIHDQALLAGMDPDTKMLPVWRMLIKLHCAGRRSAKDWLRKRGRKLGKVSTVDLTDRYGPS
ncbi:patatin-like phospholipase family protein [Croceicoccus marinus]|uniref:Patatin-like phospholipase family protein n=1 Tax=Croceicoccus marinus TaxID=450378 RepID=A0A7G6VW97_9SPHN|nr:patatin-like phospholipase family protein [Croceicoccus marinus]QNE06012.1 patatin-like phospholipase family protein [Croceicoccus marinus]